MTPSPRRLLGIFAHPDDESFGPGGTLAKYAAQGVEVHVCIATDGAAGSTDPEHLNGYSSLAARRADELRVAVEMLGGTLHMLGYPDSGMAGSPANENPTCLVQTPVDQVAREIVRLIRAVRPQVVLTHDPTGGYFHPDHIKVNQAVARAWELAGDPAYTEVELPPWQPTRLFWHVIPRSLVQWFARIARLFGQDPSKFGRNNDIDLSRLGTPEEQIHTRIDVRDYLPIKEAASAAHVSQGGAGAPWMRLPLWLRKQLLGREPFTQAYPASPLAPRDFFEGLAVEQKES